ncbi:type II/IV secretion system protein [Patescibacteria group bacterium]|nr:type II/IV secretion system protein [Patescibacteria group bacterium]
MALTDADIGKLLLDQNYLSEEELQKIGEQAKELKVSLLNLLIDQGLFTRQLYESALAEHYKLDFYDLASNPPSSEVVSLIPEEVARSYSALVVKQEGDTVTVATSDPSNEKLEEAIRMNFGQGIAVMPKTSEKEESISASAAAKAMADKKATADKKEEKDGKEEKEEKETKEEKDSKDSKDEGAEANKGAEGDDKTQEKEKLSTQEHPSTGADEKLKKDEKEEKEEKKVKKKSTFSFSFRKKKTEEVRKEFKGKVVFVFAPKSSIEAAFFHYQKPLATRFQKIIEAQKKVAPEILEEILDDAIQLRASDIHFEPQEKIVVVRFRVDGVMHEAGRIPKEHYEGVLNRIKIDANMRIDEHFAPQDGAIRHKTNSGGIDIRVSVVPVVDGEKVVMRLLSEYVRHLTLGDLGFCQEYQETLKRAAHKPFGMILTTGPTGSGKSTTLYALLKMRNSPDVNISTIEDPVEYKIAGINHIQVNNKAELTFATGLRALVRQDPDILLVGEIRDGETADISVNAALTGHLLFSTLHANDAATAVPRLLEMGVEPFLLASTLEVIIGQRLVRRICPQCRRSYSVEKGEAIALFPGADKFFTNEGPVTLYRGKGCEGCGNTGYRGRVGIYELLEITSEIEELIIARSTSAAINKAACKGGMRLMFEDGFEKVRTGMTTIEELLRVAAPPEVVSPPPDAKSKPEQSGE